MKYIYSFSVWPDRLSGFSESFRELFELLNHSRIEYILTEEEFEHFRHQLSVDGLDLHEIERKLDSPVETVL